MSVCAKFGRRLWPFLIALFFSLFAAFLTWLTLSSAGIAGHVNFGWTVAVFLAVLTLLLVYVINCLRRYCGPGAKSGAEHSR